LSNIDELFDSFIKRISITDAEDEKAKKWTREIKEGIEEKDKVFNEKVFLSGSCKRETAISPLHDIDLYIVLKSDLQTGEYEPSKLRNYYQQITKSIDDEIESLKHFKHGLKTKVSGLDIDIILTKYLRKSEKLYEIVSDDKWIITSPIFHERRLKDKNIETDGMAHNFIKIMKYWNAKKMKPLSSFHLEALVLDEIPKNVEKYSKGMGSLFRNIAKSLKERKKNPIKEAPYIDNLTLNERERAIKLLKQSELQVNQKEWVFIFGKVFNENQKISTIPSTKKSKKKKKFDPGILDGDDPYIFYDDD